MGRNKYNLCVLPELVCYITAKADELVKNGTPKGKEFGGVMGYMEVLMFTKCCCIDSVVKWLGLNYEIDDYYRHKIYRLDPKKTAPKRPPLPTVRNQQKVQNKSELETGTLNDLVFDLKELANKLIKMKDPSEAFSGSLPAYIDALKFIQARCTEEELKYLALDFDIEEHYRGELSSDSGEK